MCAGAHRRLPPGRPKPMWLPARAAPNAARLAACSTTRPSSRGSCRSGRLAGMQLARSSWRKFRGICMPRRRHRSPRSGAATRPTAPRLASALRRGSTPPWRARRCYRATPSLSARSLRGWMVSSSLSSPMAGAGPSTASPALAPCALGLCPPKGRSRRQRRRRRWRRQRGRGEVAAEGQFRAQTWRPWRAAGARLLWPRRCAWSRPGPISSSRPPTRP
mmetsp:Transcript_75637/g.162192  ORF Transcript_75637/g.162192 Transcript_75637/m.162192 type:complete len:219 (-) Transcript_75637:1846-2502(-)